MQKNIGKGGQDVREQTGRLFLNHSLPQMTSDHWCQVAIAGSHDGLWARNIPSNDEWWSPRFYELLGYQEGEIDACHSKLLELVHPEDRPFVLEAMRSHLEDLQNYDLEFRVQTKAKEYRWFKSHGHTVRNKTGKPVWMSGSMRDITLQKETEAELKKTKELLDLMLSATTDGIWDWNISTGEVFFSPQWFRALGYEPGELPSHVSSWEKLVHPDDMPTVRAELELHFNRKKAVYEVENRLRTKSGEWRYNLDRGRVVQWNEDGKPLRMVGSDIDITGRKKAEDKIANLQLELAHLSRTTALAEMAAGLIHEVSQPAFTISNIASTYLHALEYDEIDFKEAVSHLRVILTEARRVDTLLRCTREFVRKKHSHFSKCDINSLLGEIKQLVSIEARRRSTTIEMEMESDLPMVLCDKVQIQQIVLNLVNNSLDAVCDNTPENRRVIVSSQLKQDGKIVIAVRDNGKGISSQNQERVFDAFYTTKEDGLGMGLAVSASLVKAHHGSLTVKSNFDSGVTFFLTLPTDQCRSKCAKRSKL